MLRIFSVLAAMIMAGCSQGLDMTPYVWPEPVYGVPWEATSFSLRYSDWWNNPDQIRETIAHYCGPAFTTARVTPQYNVGPIVHPNSLSVSCGDSPQPKPEFRGQRINDSYLMSLKPSAPGTTRPNNPTQP